MARSLNRVQLIGNLTRDPELRYTPNGTAVCSFGLATNRSWTTDTGERHDETEFHNIVSWNKLAELCSRFLVKGRKVYVEGRLATRSWTTQDGQQRQRVEVVIDDMILLDSRRPTEGEAVRIEEEVKPEAVGAVKAFGSEAQAQREEVSEKPKKGKSKKQEGEEVEASAEDIPDDIPF